MIRNNPHNYSVSAKCVVLEVPRRTFYYQPVEKRAADGLTKDICLIFNGTKQLWCAKKNELEEKGWNVSRRRIGRIMKEEGVAPKYNVGQFKPVKSQVNEEPVKNELDRQFDNPKELAVVVSNLTYVRVYGNWHYVCLLVDLFNREIFGHSCDPRKTSSLVYKALASIRRPLGAIQMFHTDRGSEFKNK